MGSVRPLSYLALLVGVLLAGVPQAVASEATSDGLQGAWRYEGAWSRGADTWAVFETRSVDREDGGGYVYRSWRTIHDAEGGAFSWQNETRHWDGTGTALHANMTLMTYSDGSWRRIGVDTVYDAPCAEPWSVVTSSVVRCTGVRTLLGVPRAFDETIAYDWQGNVTVEGPKGPVETSRVEARAGSAVVSYWIHPAACGAVREETVTDDTRLELRLVRGGCGLPDATPVDELTYEEYQRMQGQDPAEGGPAADSTDEDPSSAEDNETGGPETFEAAALPVVVPLLAMFVLFVAARARHRGPGRS